MVKYLVFSVVAVFGALCVSCAEEEGEGYMYERITLLNDGETAGDVRSSLCSIFVNGTTFGWGSEWEAPPNDLSVEARIKNATLMVTIRSKGELLGREELDQAFINSTVHRVIKVTTRGGAKYNLEYWGGATCETSMVVP